MKSVYAFFVAAIVASLLIDAYDAATAIEVQKGHSGKCVRKGQLHENGDEWDEECQRLICSSFNGTYMQIEYQGCGAIGVPPGVKLSEIDTTLPYPDCCPQPLL